MSSKEILVSIALGSQDIRIGKLWFHARGHKESASFEYDKEWLDHPEKFALEPALKLLFAIVMAASRLLNFQKKMMSLVLLLGKQ